MLIDRYIADKGILANITENNSRNDDNCCNKKMNNSFSEDSARIKRDYEKKDKLKIVLE